MDRRATVATQLTGSSIAVNWVAFPGLSILPLGNSLSIDDLVQLGRFRFKIDLTKESEEKVGRRCRRGFIIPQVKESRALIDKIVKENRVVYGITTGFGKFARTVIEKEKLHELQVQGREGRR